MTILVLRIKDNLPRLTISTVLSAVIIVTEICHKQSMTQVKIQYGQDYWSTN